MKTYGILRRHGKETARDLCTNFNRNQGQVTGSLFAEQSATGPFCRYSDPGRHSATHAGACCFRRQRTQSTKAQRGKMKRLMLDGGREVVQLTITLTGEPLLSRRCNRCESTEFRAVLGAYGRYRANCGNIDCLPDNPCGKSLQTVPSVINCGDWMQSELWDESSPSTRPIAICMNCGKIVDLV